MENMNRMYKFIEDLCKNKGINMTQMCREAGIPRGNLTDLKKGRTAALSTLTLTKIANYFDIPIDFLIARPEEMDKIYATVFAPQSKKEQKKEPVNNDELSKKQLMLIDFARSVPADKIDLVLRVMKSIVEDE